jgi:hypothetical protein
MALVYDLKTIGTKDWYTWGAQLLVADQQADGSWQGEFAGRGCDTCFALLFLRRANPVSDLTEILRRAGIRPEAGPDTATYTPPAAKPGQYRPQAYGEIRRFAGHLGQVVGVGFSPNGHQ